MLSTSISSLLLVYISYLVFIDAREVVNINHSWRFTKLPAESNANIEVHIPHKYNLDALAGIAEYYRGPALYTKNITISVAYKGKAVHIISNGLNVVARLTINGNFIGEHQGGYNKF